MLRCPRCGGQDVRVSSARTLGEEVRSLFGVPPVRCMDCRHRFVVSLWRFRSLPYAKCPRCYRMDLTTWAEGRYRPRFSDEVKLFFGARRRRCEYCRCNFVSFRLLKEKFQKSGPVSLGHGHEVSDEDHSPETEMGAPHERDTHQVSNSN